MTDMVNPAGDVVSIRSRTAYRPDFRGLASGQVRAARKKLRLDLDAFAEYLGGILGWTVMPGVVARWEDGDGVPPGDVLLAAAAAADERYGLDRDQAMGTDGGPWIPLPDPKAAQGPLTGIWRSTYEYVSSGRGGKSFSSEHYLVLIQYGTKLQARSLPESATSRLAMDLTVNGQVVTGAWTEQTEPDGYYQGAVYHGAIQMLLEPTGRKMTGKWVGFGRDFDVNTGAWRLELVSSDTGREAMERFNRAPEPR
jgi:hypothetical protein